MKILFNRIKRCTQLISEVHIFDLIFFFKFILNCELHGPGYPVAQSEQI